MWTVSVFLLLLQSEIEEASLCRRLLQAAQFEKQSLPYKRKQYMDRVIFMQRPRKQGLQSRRRYKWPTNETAGAELSKTILTSSAELHVFIVRPVRLKGHM